MTEKRSGTVALVGRPNGGKSTLLNRLVAQKVAIVSDKPQTTRHRLMGILTEERGQMVLVDTPGVHKPKHRLNRQMVKAAVQALTEVDVVCLLVDAPLPFGGGDRYMLSLLENVSVPRVLALNKVDLVKKLRLLPIIERYHQTGLFEEIVPISALNGDGVEDLASLLWDRLPEGAPAYNAELATLQPERFLVAERIREKVLLNTRDELPFSTAVLIEGWNEAGENNRLHIEACLLVEKENQRRILIGRGGQMIKALGIEARRDIEDFLDRPLFLHLHVRCVPGWREKETILSELDREAWTVL